jgi:ABC-2 type transport system permease protein
MFQRILTLIIKELQELFRDPRSRHLLYIPVLIQVSIFPFAATLEVKNNTLGIYNQDTGDESIELIQRFSKTKAFPKVKFLHNSHEVRHAIDNQNVLLAINFLNDFSKNVITNKSAKVQIIGDGRRSNAAQIATGYMQQVVDSYNHDLRVKNASPTPVSTVSTYNWFNPNLEYYWYILPTLIALITTIGCLIVTTMSVAREREQGTFEQLFVSPLTPGSIMIGKSIPALIIASLQASIIFLAAVFVYRVPFQGSVLLLYLSILCYGLSLSGVGLLISALSSTQQQALIGVFAFNMPAILLSGVISPIENIPEPLRSITWFNPVRHFVELTVGIYLKGYNLDLVWQNLWPLLIIAILTLSLAYFKYQRILK